MANRHMTESKIKAFERQLSEQAEDVRNPPDDGRHKAFVTGWNRADRGRDYTPKTLKRLTWDNLGYRMRKEFGPQSDEQRDRAYTVLANEYRARFLEPKKSLAEAPEEESSEWLEQKETDEVIERRLAERLEQKRDVKQAVDLKRLYDNTCMFCGTRLQVAEDRFYSEAAHIKGLGEPHNGPDKKSNMLVLCPNHHVQFDRGVLRLHKVGAHYRINSKTATDPLHGKKITLTHSIDDDCVKYHSAQT